MFNPLYWQGLPVFRDFHNKLIFFNELGLPFIDLEIGLLNVPETVSKS